MQNWGTGMIKKLSGLTQATKVIDAAEGIVEAYVNTMGVIDSDNDVIRPGAFTKSIAERGPKSPGNRKIAHLRDHDFTHQIGTPIELWEDSKGLGFVSQMGRSTKGNDAFLDYQDGILREHSIGFNYISDKIDYVEPDKSQHDDEEGHYEIREVKLWEGSGVTFGANSITPVVDVAKGLIDHNITLKKINELTTVLEGALKNGKGTDERLLNIEQMFAQLKQLHK